MLDGSADLTRLINSPVFSGEDQAKAIAAIADKAGITGLVGNFLRVVARNRRLFAVPGIIKAFRQIAAEASRRGHCRGHLGARADRRPADRTQGDAQERRRQERHAHRHVDPSLIGGLVVKVGSRMIDTRSKPNSTALKIAMKEVG